MNVREISRVFWNRALERLSNRGGKHLPNRLRAQRFHVTQDVIEHCVRLLPEDLPVSGVEGGAHAS